MKERRFGYDILGCDRHELLLGIAGAWPATRPEPPAE